MRFLLVTLGCAKNEVDSDRMRALLLADGFEETADAAEADVALVNTCSFLASATEESVEATLALAEERAGAFAAIMLPYLVAVSTESDVSGSL